MRTARYSVNLVPMHQATTCRTTVGISLHNH